MYSFNIQLINRTLKFTGEITPVIASTTKKPIDIGYDATINLVFINEMLNKLSIISLNSQFSYKSTLCHYDIDQNGISVD